jgi:O-acetyl-ADP-ribose deacetylase (regulator of RNase III)
LRGLPAIPQIYQSRYLLSRDSRPIRCLEVADELGLRSLALPAFGTGVGGFPLAECARLMVDAVAGYEPISLEHVLFAVFGAEAEGVFRAALAKRSSEP